MAQTNDSKLLEKVLSKATEDYQHDNAIMELVTGGQESLQDFGMYKHGYLAGARRMQKEARLATLDDCKTLLEVIVARFERKNTGSGFYSGEITGLKVALAELEALKTSLPKEVLSRTADDKK